MLIFVNQENNNKITKPGPRKGLKLDFMYYEIVFVKKVGKMITHDESIRTKWKREKDWSLAFSVLCGRTYK